MRSKMRVRITYIIKSDIEDISRYNILVSLPSMTSTSVYVDDSAPDKGFIDYTNPLYNYGLPRVMFHFVRKRLRAAKPSEKKRGLTCYPRFDYNFSFEDKV